jgi:cytochrome c oxidase assembly factor 6
MNEGEKTTRELCWRARDEFFQCLDREVDASVQCKELRDAFTKACPRTWVKYWEDRKKRGLPIRHVE